MRIMLQGVMNDLVWRQTSRESSRPVMIIVIAAVVIAIAAGGCSMMKPVEKLASAPEPKRTSKKYSWEEKHAKIDAKGDISWAPQPFIFEAGDSIRYIDFEKGNDSNSGTGKDAAWKHHPWDSNASGNAAACAGIHTYVFKGGIDYRGMLTVKDEGRPGNPVKLTRDPSWGNGLASLLGSERVTGWTKGVTNAKIPEPDKVWYADIDFSPRTLWMVAGDGKAVRIPLARTPNWKPDPDDQMNEWWTWSNEPHAFKNDKGPVAYDSKNIKGRDVDYVKGAIIRSEYGWVMGAPYPTLVEDVDPSNGGVTFARWTGGGRGGIIFRGMRYYLEDKPQYLDDPDGEFWLEKKGNGGRLFVRLPGGKDPNSARLEAGKRPDLIYGKRVKHLEISGLDFRFTTPHWDLCVVKWDLSTKPWGWREDAQPACIRVWGEGRDIRIANCNFEDVVMPIVMRATPGNVVIEDVLIEDNTFLNADVGIMSLADGTGWDFPHRLGELRDVRVFRNYAREIGYRPGRYFAAGTGMDFQSPVTLHVAGNVIERVGGQGINATAGKQSGIWGDVPLSRILIHNNKVWQSMQTGNDYGGIEAWQHGPVYIFNNLSYDARGLREAHRKFDTHHAGSGHAYYLDGGFKCYLFNNIAWGRSNDDTSKLVNCSAFQEILSYQNSFFNNTVYNYYIGSRRQAPHAGRNKYIGNIWSDISNFAFRHADPAKTAAEGNANDAGPQKSSFAYETSAYAQNVFYDVAEFGVFETSGRWLKSLDDFRNALKKRKSMVAELGVMDGKPPLTDPAHGDFRPAPGSKAIGRGAVVFVPWALYGVVGEWKFYHSGDTPARIIDEHWYAKDYYTVRDDYYKMPMYPLMAVNVGEEDYEEGVLENWTKGALHFKTAKKQYASVLNNCMVKPLTVNAHTKFIPEGGKPEDVTIAGKDLKTPQVYDSNFLIEAYFKTEPLHTDGILVSKIAGRGYSLRVNKGGGVTFTVNGGGKNLEAQSTVAVNDGEWHHVIAECDREARNLVIYIDGRKNTEAPGVSASDSLDNESDLYVGGTPAGKYFNGTFEFLRICLGTLKDAKTDIDELYAWQFDGPFLRDFAGRKPVGKRDAGALERVD